MMLLAQVSAASTLSAAGAAVGTVEGIVGGAVLFFLLMKIVNWIRYGEVNPVIHRELGDQTDMTEDEIQELWDNSDWSDKVGPAGD